MFWRYVQVVKDFFPLKFRKSAYFSFLFCPWFSRPANNSQATSSCDHSSVFHEIMRTSLLEQISKSCWKLGQFKFFQGANHNVFVLPDEYCKCSTITFSVLFIVPSTLLLCVFVGLNVSYYRTVQRGLGLFFLGSSYPSLFEVISLLFVSFFNYHVCFVVFPPICRLGTILVF